MKANHSESAQCFTGLFRVVFSGNDRMPTLSLMVQTLFHWINEIIGLLNYSFCTLYLNVCTCVPDLIDISPLCWITNYREPFQRSGQAPWANIWCLLEAFEWL